VRECPKCHYVDPPYWRTPPFFSEVDYMRFDEFQQLLPMIAEQLRPGGYADDEIYHYHLSGTSRYVYRVWKPIWKALAPQGTWRELRQAGKKFYDRDGRMNKNSFTKLLKAMNSRQTMIRQERGAIEKYLIFGEKSE